jgi:hypothetical protein
MTASIDTRRALADAVGPSKPGGKAPEGFEVRRMAFGH